MTEWKARRLWKRAATGPVAGGYGVLLDERALQTPGKTPLALPTLRAAQAVAAEWQGQGEVIDPLSMPVTRAANAAIDKVARQKDEVIARLAEYAETDLLCYRAEGPAALVARQSAGWDPLLDWAGTRYGARLIAVEGVMHAPQPPRALHRLTAPLAGMDAFQLTAMHDLVALSGSLVIALAAIEAHLPATELWARSRIDESWQEELWGIDDEAATLAADRREAFLRALDFFRLFSENP